MRVIPAILLALLAALPVQAATTLCLEVRTGTGEDAAGFQALVKNQLGHHPSHLLATTDCQSHLLVELFRAGGARFLTARIDQEVPVRYPVKDAAALTEKLATALSLVLGNDPQHLSADIGHYSAVQRAAHSVLVRGHNYYRLELFQLMGNGNDNAVFAPGAAFSLSRGADHWQVFARVHGAGWPGSPEGDKAALRLGTGAEVGVTYEFLELASVSPYVSAGLGLQFLRFEGWVTPKPVPGLPPPERDYQVVNQFLGGVTLRAGLRFLRLFDFDCDVFVAARLPFLKTYDEDSALMDHYTPTFEVGFGVGF